jgi:hypothetical protein
LAVTILVAFGRDQHVADPLMVPLVMVALHELAQDGKLLVGED